MSKDYAKKSYHLATDKPKSRKCLWLLVLCLAVVFVVAFFAKFSDKHRNVRQLLMPHVVAGRHHPNHTSIPVLTHLHVPPATTKSTKKQKAPPLSSQPKFEFYHVLSQPHHNVSAHLTTQESGKYTLQVAAFNDKKAAQAFVNQLALMGLDSRIKHRTTVKDLPYRVYIGHFATLKQAKAKRRMLKAAQIDSITIKTGG